MKRIIDILLSSVAIVIFFIPMVVISLAIKLNSKGPIFFKQQRVGRNGRLFEIYKFRSMYTETPNVSTEDLENPSIYITPVGKLIRKTSLDELPQLLNILKGNMSIVGPRPALFNQYELIEMRKEAKVDTVHPGLTGYAQIMGRDLISDTEKVAYDKYYVENHTLFLDIKIIWCTFFSVIKAEGIKMK